MKKEAIDLILEKNPDLKSYRTALEAIQSGKYCWHRTWGIGYVETYDEVNNRVIINFEKGQQGHAMDPIFCVQKLQFMDDNNVLVEARKNPKQIEGIYKENPVELVVKVLNELPNKSLNTVELQVILGHALSPFLSEIQFKKWWNQTQKLLEKDPRIAAPKKRSEPYTLRSEPILPEQAVLEEFYLTRQHLKKVALAEKLYRLADSVDTIREDLPQILEELTKAIQNAKQLTAAQRLHGCWVRNDLARYLQEDVENLQPTSRSFILESENLSKLAEELPPAYYKRFLDLITRTYPTESEWEHICLQLLKNSTGKFTSECINFLIEKEKANSLAETFQKWLQEQHLRAPVLLWIVKNRQNSRYENLIKPLLSTKLLGAILQAIDWEALNTPTGRRIPLVETLLDDKELIGDLLQTSSFEAAKDLAQSLLMNQGFDILTKRSILARFIKVYPSLQSLVEGKMDRQEEPLWVSAESLDLLKQEYESLINKKIPENTKAVAAARELGDLRENSEYKMARQDQDMLLARKSQIEKDLSAARIFNPAETSIDCVGIGSVVEVEDSKGKHQTITVLGAWDSDPKKNIVSYKTPLGQSLLGKKVGEICTSTPIEGSTQTLTIKKISRLGEK